MIELLEAICDTLDAVGDDALVLPLRLVRMYLHTGLVHASSIETAVVGGGCATADGSAHYTGTASSMDPDSSVVVDGLCAEIASHIADVATEAWRRSPELSVAERQALFAAAGIVVEPH